MRGIDNKTIRSQGLVAGGATVVVGLPRSCVDELARDGVTTIYLYRGPTEFRCDLHSPGGPWTTFQRRVDTTSFDRDWNAYKTGFANAEKGKDGSFWLGNDHIHELTMDGAKLRVDLCTLPEGNETSRELLESPEFERLEDWNLTFEGAKSNGYISAFLNESGKGVSSARAASTVCLVAHLGPIRIAGHVHPLVEILQKRDHGFDVVRRLGRRDVQHHLRVELLGRHRVERLVPRHIAAFRSKIADGYASQIRCRSVTLLASSICKKK